MSVLDKLTEGIVNRDLQKEGAALLNKWEKTGLLEGIDNDNTRHGMARLLENQAKQLLKETAGSAMAQGDVEGFASVAFPLVRRVFGGLLANDLVSVQPMSLPSGLIFFLDFTYGGTVDAPTVDRLGFQAGKSVYGGDVVGAPPDVHLDVRVPLALDDVPVVRPGLLVRGPFGGNPAAALSLLAAALLRLPRRARRAQLASVGPSGSRASAPERKRPTP